MTEKSYQVTGMTCAHCVNAVTEEVGRIPGVQHVEVQLDGGVVVVSGTEFSDEQVAAAIDEAGYAIA